MYYIFLLQVCSNLVIIGNIDTNEDIVGMYLFFWVLYSKLNYVIVITRSRDDYGKYNLSAR